MVSQVTNTSNANVFGINEPKLEQLVLEISEVAERVNKKFIELSDLVNSTSLFYDCESGSNFRNSFDKLKANFPIVNKNILCYSFDLVKVKSRLYNIDTTVERNFSIAKGEVLSKSIDRYVDKF